MRYNLDRQQTYEVRATFPCEFFLRVEAASAEHAQAIFLSQLLATAHEPFTNNGADNELDVTFVPSGEIDVEAKLEQC
jgi:hypothetical protein